MAKGIDAKTKKESRKVRIKIIMAIDSTQTSRALDISSDYIKATDTDFKKK